MAENLAKKGEKLKKIHQYPNHPRTQHFGSILFSLPPTHTKYTCILFFFCLFKIIFIYSFAPAFTYLLIRNSFGTSLCKADYHSIPWVVITCLPFPGEYNQAVSRLWPRLASWYKVFTASLTVDLKLQPRFSAHPNLPAEFETPS